MLAGLKSLAVLAFGFIAMLVLVVFTMGFTFLDSYIWWSGVRGVFFSQADANTFKSRPRESLVSIAEGKWAMDAAKQRRGLPTKMAGNVMLTDIAFDLDTRTMTHVMELGADKRMVSMVIKAPDLLAKMFDSLVMKQCAKDKVKRMLFREGFKYRYIWQVNGVTKGEVLTPGPDHPCLD